MSGVKIENNVFYQLLEEASKPNITAVQKRIVLLALRSAIDYSALLTLREINRRNGLPVERVGKFDANRLAIVTNLVSLKLVTLQTEKYILTSLGKELIEVSNIDLSKHLQWYLSHVAEEQDHV